MSKRNRSRARTVTVDIDLMEFDDDDLIDELTDRGFIVLETDRVALPEKAYQEMSHGQIGPNIRELILEITNKVA